MQTLFPDVRSVDPVDSAPRAKGPFASVALEHSIDRLLDYSIPPKLLTTVRVGQRVRVPLGRSNKKTHGYIVAIHETSEYPRIKPLFDIEDERVLITPSLMELARWMSRYYVAPLGTVIESIIPAAVKKKVGIGYNQMVRLAQPRERIQEILEKTKAPKRRAILARLLLLDPDASIDVVRLASEAGATVPTVRKLTRLGLIRITSEVDLPRLTADLKPFPGDEPDIKLNEEQQHAMSALLPRLTSGFSVNLLHGVTGSGKTEIYLQCIRKIVETGRQAIVLVPEIALTPQTVRRFTARFQRVAILHSGLGATMRHRYWQQIAIGHADVIVGARSAIFAPVPNLGMIVVDEEHEASYKQDTAPRYHARDVAIKRCQLENVPVLLGSATPSLETYSKVVEASDEATKRRSDEGVKTADSTATHSLAPERGEGGGEGFQHSSRPPSRDTNRTESPHPNPLPFQGRGGSGEASSARSGYHLITLHSRVRGLKLPQVELVDMKTVNKIRGGGIQLISPRLEHLLRATIDQGHQAILLLNRRGYSNFVYCVSCGEVVQCKYCDTTMTFHRSAGTHPHGGSSAEGSHTGQLHCHYCLAVNPLPALCTNCGKKLSLFGLGTQRVEEELMRKLPNLKFARVDSDSMRSAKDYEATLGRFARKEIQLMLGTQMIAKGLDFPNVTLVGVISGDTALALPDFRAAERTFQLITQVAGRAGRGDAAGRVVLQTFLPDDPTIQAAIRQDFVGFAKQELKARRELTFPPYSRMVRIILRDEDQDKLHKHSEELAVLVGDAVAKEGDLVKMKGPMPCAISRIAGYYRNQIVLMSPTPARLQRVLAEVRDKGALARSERIAVDVDPVSLL